jgi:hypothetical protein
VNNTTGAISDGQKRVGVMVFDATFNNISVILRRSVLVVEETGEPGEKHQPVESY